MGRFCERFGRTDALFVYAGIDEFVPFEETAAASTTHLERGNRPRRLHERERPPSCLGWLLRTNDDKEPA